MADPGTAAGTFGGKREEATLVGLIREIARIAEIPATIIDVGGNKNAEISSPFAAAGWKALIIEPQLYCFQLLQRKFAAATNVTLLKVACGEAADTARLSHGVDGPGSEVATLNREVDPWTAKVVSQESFEDVPVVTLAELIEAHPEFRDAGVLKIDTEAWDYHVLKGLDLERNKPCVIITEEYLWKIDAAVDKHLMLESAGYVDLGFVGYNTIWVHRRCGARWSYGMLGPWLRAAGRREPFALLGHWTHSIEPLVRRTRTLPGLDYVGQNVALLAERDHVVAAGGQGLNLRVTVINLSAAPLPCLPASDGSGGISLSYHCENPKTGAMLTWDGVRTPLPRDIVTGEALVIDAQVELPPVAGQIRLVFDLVQESVAWFGTGRAKGHPRAEVLVAVPGPATPDEDRVAKPAPPAKSILRKLRRAR